VIEILQNKLENAVNFPSPPAIAQQIIELASDPDTDVIKVAQAIAKDPGLTAKVLRVANSPLYSKRRKSENLRQALITLGLNATTTLALSFSLVGAYKNGKGTGIDYTRYWRRAILGASAARAFGVLQNAPAPDDIFLAALLQDIAVLAVDRVQPDFYAALPLNSTHAQLTAHEHSAIGADHAALGAWLLRHWKLPESLCEVVESSHDPDRIAESLPAGVAARCVALGSDCVEVLLSANSAPALQLLSARGQQWGLGAPDLAQAMTNIVAEIPEIERLFDTRLLDQDAANAILEQARELLTLRNLQALEQVSALTASSDHLQARTAQLEDQHRRDALTGVFNRGHLDQVLAKEFAAAVTGGWPLSVVFADLDRFKQVNDTYGHPAGDTVLIATAKIILDVVRDTDCVARYGGEEFVIVLPGLAAAAAGQVCERLLKRLREAQHVVAGGTIRATASLGLATHSTGTPFASVARLIGAADRSVYAAKKAGRDRLVYFDVESGARSA
jgi:diguanylate cyclase (GGDEF)-like protein